MDDIKSKMLSSKRQLNDGVSITPQNQHGDRCIKQEQGSTQSKISAEQMKLTVYANNGLITVHVIQARHLNSRWGTTCDAYVKVHLIPEEASKRARCKTGIVNDTNHPMFDERFSIEVSEADYDRRLYLSVWNRDSTKRCSEFLGCMSFGIKRLLTSMKQSISGWYYLMSEETGRRRHLQASSSKHGILRERVNNRPVVNKKSKIEKQELTKDAFTVVMQKGKQGYGFTVCGTGPVHIGKVEQGSVAEAAGLLANDQINVLNGKAVHKVNCDTVAEIIRTSYRQIVVDVERYCEPGRCPWHSLSRQQTNNNRAGSDEDKENLSQFRQTPSIRQEEQPQMTVAYKTLSVMEQQHQLATQSLLECEREFITLMRAGVHTYSRPLRHRFLNTNEHRAIFQNVEKLVALSEFHVKQLEDSGVQYSDVESHAFIDAVGAVYQSKGGFYREAYSEYGRGLRKAGRVLTLLVRSKPELQTFLMSSQEGSFDISTFIHKPLEHLTEVTQILQVILQNTSSNSHDHVHLKQTVEGLSSLLNNEIGLNDTTLIQQNDTTQCPPTPSFVDDLDSDKKSTISSQRSCSLKRSAGSLPTSGSLPSASSLKPSTGSLSTSGSLLSVSSMHSASVSSTHSRHSSVSDRSSSSADSELLNLQSKLLFAENVKMFYLAAPNRHFIYASDLLMVDGRSWSKVHVLLLTDMILLTQRETDGRLTIVREPVLINSIVSATFDCAHPTEVNLTLEMEDEETLKRSDTHDITVRAPNMEQKYVWKSLLEHRINAHNTLRELAPPSCHVQGFVESFGVL